LHRCGDYITLIKNGVNPLQAMFFIFFSSVMVVPGAILGMYISFAHQEQVPPFLCALFKVFKSGFSRLDAATSCTTRSESSCQNWTKLKRVLFTLKVVKSLDINENSF
jgi:hypothetical protein